MPERHELPNLLFQQWVGRREIAVSRYAAPMSIRDQIVRSRLLAHQCVESGVLGEAVDPHSGKTVRGGPTEGTVVVIGGGVAGVAFALAVLQATAEWGGINVALIDRGEQLFGPQLAAAHRVIDPTLYDWPDSQWTRNVYPLDGTPYPLKYEPATAKELASRWREALKSYDSIGRLKVYTSATAEPDQPKWIWLWGWIPGAKNLRLKRARFIREIKGFNGKTPQVQTGFGGTRTDAGTAGIDNCILIVQAFGVGKERCEIDNSSFRGYDFWTPEGYSHGPDSSILICGGGDGAIQDLIRLATGDECKSPAELLSLLFPGGDDSTTDWEATLETIGSRVRGEVAEEIASWATGSSASLSQATAALEEKMNESITMLEEDHPCDWDYAKRKAVRLARDRSIDVCHRQATYEHCYALNRLVALLLFKLLPHTITRRPKSKPLQITPKPKLKHVCDKTPSECVSNSHLVMFNVKSKLEDYDVIVVRYGRLPADPGNDEMIRVAEGEIPAGGWRQLLPLSFRA